MACILKADKTFSDDYGNVYTNPYGVIDEFECNKRKCHARIQFNIYKDKGSCDAGKKFIAFFVYDITNEQYDQYFSVEAITNDDNEYKQAYLYLLQLHTKIIQDDGTIVDGDLVWGDWQSDEV